MPVHPLGGFEAPDLAHLAGIEKRQIQPAAEADLEDIALGERHDLLTLFLIGVRGAREVDQVRKDSL